MRRAKGQSLVEVAIVLALIAIAAIAVITVYGDEVRKVFGISDGSLAGETDLEHEPKPDGVSEKHNLGNFAKQNSPDCANGVCSYH
jgi:Flp pilus assembly pilin Flp